MRRHPSLHLAPFLRCVVSVGEAALRTRLDLKRVGLGAVYSGNYRVVTAATEPRTISRLPFSIMRGDRQ